MKKQHLTIHDIARELNISASTVSRALHNHPRISLSTRDAVQKLAADYNYQPNVMASSLRKGESKTVGVIVPRINRNFFANVIGGMEEVLSASGYHLMICQTHEQLENEISAIKTLVNVRVDAILLSISMETSGKDHLQILLDRGIRLFFFDRVFERMNAGSVVINDRLGAYLNVKHLLDQGYRNIMHIAGPDHISIYRARKEGYLEAMDEAGINVPMGWIMERTLIQEGGKSAFLTGLELSAKPDAYFCAGDFAALGVMQAAQKRGLRVPDDLGISGFANEPFTAFMEPSLTTVDQRGGKMGKIVAEMFLACGERTSEPAGGERTSEPAGGERISEPAGCEKIVLKPELIVRNSSLPNK